MIIILIVIVLIVIYMFVIYNKLVSLKNLVKEAFSTMDVYLTKRWELVPNLVEIVKGYAKFEQETLEEISRIRSENYNSMSMSKKIDENMQIAKVMPSIYAIEENYPDLKANENYLDLSKKLVRLEDEIAKSRKYYNGTVKLYNNLILMFPSSLVAKMFKHNTEKMFEAKEEAKNNVKIEL